MHNDGFVSLKVVVSRGVCVTYVLLERSLLPWNWFTLDSDSCAIWHE